jgi:hypothetical protein
VLKTSLTPVSREIQSSASWSFIITVSGCWVMGNMTVAQTLAHCTSGLEMAMGVINPKRAPFPANVMGAC